jgi:transcriptional regulator with XRE-family HTH domain
MTDEDFYRVIGKRLRARRLLLGLTQRSVGVSCGLTFQQIQKYEAGATTMSVARLIALAEALQTPIGEFLAGLQDVRHTGRTRAAASWSKAADALEAVA